MGRSSGVGLPGVVGARCPALMKGFLDRVLLPGFAFKKREGSVWWDKYLTGKTARLICTLDQPGW